MIYYRYLCDVQEKERYKEPVRESLKALLAIGWTVEHTDVDTPMNARNTVRRQSKGGPVSIPMNSSKIANPL